MLVGPIIDVVVIVVVASLGWPAIKAAKQSGDWPTRSSR